MVLCSLHIVFRPCKDASVTCDCHRAWPSVAACIRSGLRTSPKGWKGLKVKGREKHHCMSSLQDHKRTAIGKIRYLKHHALTPFAIHQQRQRGLHCSNSRMTISSSMSINSRWTFRRGCKGAGTSSGLAVSTLCELAGTHGIRKRENCLRPPRYPFLSERVNDPQHLLPPLRCVHQLPCHTHADLIPTLGHQQLLQQQVPHLYTDEDSAVAAVLLPRTVVQINESQPFF